MQSLPYTDVRGAQTSTADSQVWQEDIASDEDEEGRLAARMSAGLFTLQQCAIIVANLWTIGDRGVQKRVLQLLHQQVCTLPLYSRQLLLLIARSLRGFCHGLEFLFSMPGKRASSKARQHLEADFFLHQHLPAA